VRGQHGYDAFLNQVQSNTKRQQAIKNRLPKTSSI